jgi:hypothetical protein
MAKGRKTGGRIKGKPNKITRDLREMIMGALDDAGGRKYLTMHADENPVAFIALLGKVVPKEVSLNAQGGLNLTITLGS